MSSPTPSNAPNPVAEPEPSSNASKTDRPLPAASEPNAEAAEQNAATSHIRTQANAKSRSDVSEKSQSSGDARSRAVDTTLSGSSRNAAPKDAKAATTRGSSDSGNEGTSRATRAAKPARKHATAKTKHARGKRKAAAKSSKRGGALLERALERASSQSDVPAGDDRGHSLLGPAIGVVFAESEGRQSEPYPWTPKTWETLTPNASSDGFTLEIEKRDRVITELRALISATSADISSVHAEQTSIRDTLAVASETIQTQGEIVEQLRLSFDRSVDARETEITELRRDLADSLATGDRRVEQIAELREKTESMRSYAMDSQKEIEILQRELDASDALRRDGARELASLRKSFEDSERKAHQRSEEITGLRDQISDGVRLAVERDTRIELLVRSVERAEAEIAARDVDLHTLRDAVSEGKLESLQSDEVIEQLRRTLGHEEEAASVRSEESRTLRDALAEGERSARARADELETLHRSQARVEDDLLRREEEIASIREAQVDSERVCRQRGVEIERLTHTITLRTDEATRLRETAMTDKQAHQDSIAELNQRMAAAETRSVARTDANATLREELDETTLAAERHRTALAATEVTLKQREDDVAALRLEVAERNGRGETQLAELRVQFEETKERFSRQHGRIEDLEGEIAERERSIASLERERSERTREKEADAPELYDLREKFAKSIETARETDRDRELLRREVRSHKDHAAERDIEMVDLRQQLADLIDSSHEDDRENALLDAKIEELEAGVSSALRETEAMRESLESARRSNRVEEEQARRFREGLSAAEQSLADREREILELRTAASAQTTAPTDLTRDKYRPDAERNGLDAGSELSMLRERLAQRDVEIETLHHVVTASNDRNTALRGEFSDLRGRSASSIANDDTSGRPAASVVPPKGEDADAVASPKTAIATELHEPSTPSTRVQTISTVPTPPVLNAPQPEGPSIPNQTGWNLFPWRRRRELQQESPAVKIAADTSTEELAVEPAITGPPSFNAPPDPGNPVADRVDRPDIFHYWKRTQIASKLDRPQISTADDFFLSYLLDLCNRNPNRTNHIVSIGTGSHDLEVVLARRALDAGVRNFNIHCLSEVPSTLYSERAIVAERTILANLTLLQCQMETWPTSHPYALAILNDSLQELTHPDLWLDRIVGALEPAARMLVHSSITARNGASSPVAKEIANEIWRLMPDRYKASSQNGTLEAPYPETSRRDDPEPETDAPNILGLLADRLEFEVFVAFGNVINPFIDETIGRNFDPENERDRRFIDQVATVDDGKIDSGLIPPTHILAALTVEPQTTLVYKHWTPVFCLASSTKSEASNLEVSQPEASNPEVSKTEVPEARTIDVLVD